MTTNQLRKAVTGHGTTHRVEHDGTVIPILTATALAHWTDGTRNTPTGRNLRALCGATVTPDRPEGLDACERTCPKCEALR